eukprot:1154047-Pelagomonas_calceolata.AAC.1
MRRAVQRLALVAESAACSSLQQQALAPLSTSAATLVQGISQSAASPLHQLNQGRMAMSASTTRGFAANSHDLFNQHKDTPDNNADNVFEWTEVSISVGHSLSGGIHEGMRTKCFRQHMCASSFPHRLATYSLLNNALHSHTPKSSPHPVLCHAGQPEARSGHH